MLRVIAYVFTCKDVTVIGQENLFFNLKCGEVRELGTWLVGSNSFQEAIDSTVCARLKLWMRWPRAIRYWHLHVLHMAKSPCAIWGLCWKIFKLEEVKRRFRKLKRQHLASFKSFYFRPLPVWQQQAQGWRCGNSKGQVLLEDLASRQSCLPWVAWNLSRTRTCVALAVDRE